MWQKKNSPRIVVDKAGVRLSLFFVYTGANFALLPVDPFFLAPPSDPLSDPYPDPEPVTSQWNSHLYVGYVLRKPPANTPGKDPTGLYVTANHPS